MVRKRERKLRLESLESRQLLTTWHNVEMPPDVNGDQLVTPLDALVVINELGRARSATIPLDQPRPEDAPFLDVNDDGTATVLDALLVLNAVRDQGRQAEPLGMAMNPPPPNVLEAPDLSLFPAELGPLDMLPDSQIEAADVAVLLDRASAASPSDDAIIAVVDRSGRILGVRVEAGVATEVTTDDDRLAFAIDGAVAKARTAALFSSNAAPLTSRTIRFISQSTVTQREVEAAPNHPDPRYRGPGFVAPIGVGGRFPPEIPFTPQVDLLGIERQSRDSQWLAAGADGLFGTADDILLQRRFNVPAQAIPDLAQPLMQTWPESYGVVSETAPGLRGRGIATLPGGVPLYKLVGGQPNLVGGIGVFFPGEDGFATHEQGFVPAVGQSERARTNAERVLEAEFMALAAAAGQGIQGRPEFQRNVNDINAKLPPLPGFVALNGRIDLVGITLEIYGPTPSPQHPVPGIDRLLSLGRQRLGAAAAPSGIDLPVSADGTLHLDGMPVPHGWLVAPQDSPLDGGLQAEQVEQMVLAGVAQAAVTRAAIRLNDQLLPGASTAMVFAVADTRGNVLGIYRMPDATIFSIDVAVAKARNTAYYADADKLQDADRVDFNGDRVFGEVSTSLSRAGDTLPPGTTLTNRSLRFLAAPRFPTTGELPSTTSALLPETPLCDYLPNVCRRVGPHSSLRLPGINPWTAESIDPGNPLVFDVYADPTHASPLMFDAFVPSRNLRDNGDPTVTVHGLADPLPEANQNGVVFFPGSTPLYLNAAGEPQLAGGLGVSGDGVDQDDVVTSRAQQGFAPPPDLRVDQFIVGGVRLPFQKFNRNPGL